MSAPQSTSRTKRLALPIAALVLLAAGAAWLVFRAPVALPPPPPLVQVSEPEVQEEVALRVLEVSGIAEIRESAGQWRPAQPGEELPAASSLRTLAGRAILASGERYEVVLEPGTEVSTQELTHSISRLLLERGMATANVREGQHLFEVSARGSDAIARTSDGRFTVSNDGRGTVAVATTDGAVELSGGGRLVVVRAGQQSLVRDGAGPSDPSPIPGSVLLRVQWPADGTLRRKRLVITGVTSPGAHVAIDDQFTTADADGRFEAEVGLREGENALNVRARDVGGATREAKREIRVDTTAPKVGLDRDLWGN